MAAATPCPARTGFAWTHCSGTTTRSFTAAHQRLQRPGFPDTRQHVSTRCVAAGASEPTDKVDDRLVSTLQTDPIVPEREAGSALPPPPPPPPSGLVGRIKSFFIGDRLDKQRLAALGMGAVASYGLISNVTYGAGLAVSWIAFVKQFGKGPLMPGQWKPFLAYYAGFWTLQNFVRPLRFSLALALAPSFDRFISAIQARTGLNRRNAFGVYLFLLGTVTTITIFGSIRIWAGPLAYARSAL